MMHCLVKTHENRRVKLIDTLRGGKKKEKVQNKNSELSAGEKRQPQGKC